MDRVPLPFRDGSLPPGRRDGGAEDRHPPRPPPLRRAAARARQRSSSSSRSTTRPTSSSACGWAPTRSSPTGRPRCSPSSGADRRPRRLAGRSRPTAVTLEVRARPVRPGQALHHGCSSGDVSSVRRGGIDQVAGRVGPPDDGCTAPPGRPGRKGTLGERPRRGCAQLRVVQRPTRPSRGRRRQRGPPPGPSRARRGAPPRATARRRRGRPLRAHGQRRPARPRHRRRRAARRLADRRRRADDPGHRRRLGEADRAAGLLADGRLRPRSAHRGTPRERPGASPITPAACARCGPCSRCTSARSRCASSVADPRLARLDRVA